MKSLKIFISSPEIYVQINQLQRHDAQYSLDEYMHLIRWNPHGSDSVMDIGCGPGDITTKILLPKLPASVRELVGTDISPKMIQYARRHYQLPPVSYEVLDIATKTLPSLYYERFDHLFSNYCLHWVKDQRQAIGNIFNMLRPGGDILLLYLAKHLIVDIIVEVSVRDHWKPFIKDRNVFVLVYQYTPNLEEVLRGLLQEVGFKSITCQGRQNTFTYESIESCFDQVTAYHPVFQTFSKDHRAQFMEECVTEFRSQTNTDDIVTHNDQFVMTYSSIIINATKPVA